MVNLHIRFQILIATARALGEEFSKAPVSAELKVVPTQNSACLGCIFMPPEAMAKRISLHGVCNVSPCQCSSIEPLHACARSWCCCNLLNHFLELQSMLLLRPPPVRNGNLTTIQSKSMSYCQSRSTFSAGWTDEEGLQSQNQSMCAVFLHRTCGVHRLCGSHGARGVWL